MIENSGYVGHILKTKTLSPWQTSAKLKNMKPIFEENSNGKLLFHLLQHSASRFYREMFGDTMTLLTVSSLIFCNKLQTMYWGWKGEQNSLKVHFETGSHIKAFQCWQQQEGRQWVVSGGGNTLYFPITFSFSISFLRAQQGFNSAIFIQANIQAPAQVMSILGCVKCVKHLGREFRVTRSPSWTCSLSSTSVWIPCCML